MQGESCSGVVLGNKIIQAMSGERRQSWVACWTDGPRVLPREEVRRVCDGNPMEDVEDSGERKKASWTNDRRDRNRTMNTETGNYLWRMFASVGRPAGHIYLLLSLMWDSFYRFSPSVVVWMWKPPARSGVRRKCDKEWPRR